MKFQGHGKSWKVHNVVPNSTGTVIYPCLLDSYLEHWHTSSSAIAEGQRDALSQLKSCQLLHNCTKNHI